MANWVEPTFWVLAILVWMDKNAHTVGTLQLLPAPSDSEVMNGLAPRNPAGSAPTHTVFHSGNVASAFGAFRRHTSLFPVSL